MNLIKLLQLNQPKINNAMLDLLGINYLILDTKGDLIYQNQSSKKCSLGFKNALEIDPVAWKNTQKIIQTGKEKF